MSLNELKPALGSVSQPGKRLGRGQGSGKGGTASKGHKGDKARSGHKTKKGFEGGQMPLQRRMPKYGFTNFNRQEYSVFNLSDLEQMSLKYGVTQFDMDFYQKHGFVSQDTKIKILGKGNITKSFVIFAHATSVSAASAVEKLGGKINLL
jgi:large subunit ribosomal protein L15